MKKLIITLAICFSMLIALPALAANSDASIYFNGEKQETKAVINNGRTLLPIRSICNMMGTEITYHAATKKISINNEYEFSIGSTKVTKRDVPVESLDVPPFVKKGVAYLPIRYVSDIFGASIEWKGANREVLILSPYKLQFNNELLDVHTIIRGDHVLYHVKYIRYFDMDYQYNADQKTIALTFKDKDKNDVYQLQSGSKKVLKNGKPTAAMDFPLYLYNNNHYISLEALANISGKDLNWNKEKRIISFNSWTEPIVVNGILTAYHTPDKVIDLSDRTDIKELGADVFHYTGSHLEKIILPESLEKIGVAAFAGTAIKEIHIPDGVNYIEGMAFYRCQSLKYVYLPENLTKLDSETFSDCPLTELVIPPKVREIVGENMFNAIPGVTDPAPLERIVIPPSVINISPYVFKGCGEFVIEGLPGSYAESYAKKRNITFKALTEAELNQKIANR